MLFGTQDASREYSLSCSYVEIYNEDVRDLLEKSTPKLKLREDRVKGVFLECRDVIISEPEEMMELLRLGEQHRIVGETDMNKRSSRSHTIFTIHVKSTVVDDDGSNGLLVGKLNLVDLAGSESVRTTGAVGERLKEAGKINQSLLTLARVIESLGDGDKAGFVSFRDSKLTRILQPSLVGEYLP